jgi:hypothetical protein
MRGLTPETSWRRVFTATIYHTASPSPRLPIEKPANSSSVERSSSIPRLLTSLRRLQARRSRLGALCCTRLVPPLLSPRLLPRGTLTSAESLPASTRVGLGRGVAHGRIAGSAPAEGNRIITHYAVYLRRSPATIRHFYPLELGPAAYGPLHMSRPLPSPQCPPALDLPAPSTALPRLSNTPAPGEAGRAGEKYI